MKRNNTMKYAGVLKSKSKRVVSFTKLEKSINRLRQSTEDPSSKLGASNESVVMTKGRYKVSPWGISNDFPDKLLTLIEGNNLIPGLMEFKEDMIFGNGLVVVDATGREVMDIEIEVWLNSWDVNEFILAQIADYCSLYNVFGQYIKNKAGTHIAKLAHVPAKECRLAVMEHNRVNTIYVSDWSKNTDIKAFKIFDPYTVPKLTSDIMMYHHKRPGSKHKYYALPKYIGVLEDWIPLVNQIPKYHRAVMSNSLMALFHVDIPYEALEKMRQNRGWTNEQLDEWIKDTLDGIDEMISGAENAGKTFYTYTTTKEGSQTSLSWKITPIENKTKQLSESYLNLFNDANQAITSAMQVQPSLACIQLGDKMSSGSEVLNSYNLHMQTRTNIPKSIILKSINTAIRSNWPTKNLFVTFQKILLVKQEENKTGVEKGGYPNE